ncbi:hypothetical protein VE04_07172 [Pseudogymnoascus sp. 24MN13]|nr:hypothetical protein VE04_07172 [Pseudogymnoascus sp. 24MN13]
MADEEEIPIDVQGYLSITGMPAYNPAYPPRGIPLRPLPGAGAAVVAPPPPSGTGASPGEATTTPSSCPHSFSRGPSHPISSTTTTSATPNSEPSSPPPVGLHPTRKPRGRRTPIAALQALNRFASNREAADASDAAASAISADVIASAPDPIAAEEEATEAHRAFHRELTLAMLEGTAYVYPDGEPVTLDGGPMRMAGLVAYTTGEEEQPEQSWADWSRENRWRMPVVWGGGGGDPNFTYFDHAHEAVAWLSSGLYGAFMARLGFWHDFKIYEHYDHDSFTSIRFFEVLHDYVVTGFQTRSSTLRTINQRASRSTITNPRFPFPPGTYYKLCLSTIPTHHSFDFSF